MVNALSDSKAQEQTTMPASDNKQRFVSEKQQPTLATNKNNEKQDNLLEDKIRDGKKLIDDMATPVDKDFRNFEAKDMQDVKDMSDRQTAFCNRLWNAIDAFCKKQPLSAAGKAILLQAINDYGMNNTRCHGTTAGWSSNTG